ncbi:MAG: ABC transporter ATP-binding protein [Parvularculaceae bacterium]
MFSWFEKRLEPFPAGESDAPPKTFAAFCWHYVRDSWPWLAAMSLLAALIAVGEAMIYGFLGKLVDWLTGADPQTFLAQEGEKLILIGVFVAVLLPTMGLLSNLIIHQTLLGNLPMSARWLMHKRLLGQSMSFFADEFAGRVATKLMQTSLAVREAVMKLLDIIVYVAVFFISMVVLVGQADWRLAAPLGVWIIAYVSLIAWFVPRLAKASERQADARSDMTGRIVDSYTNISTVKLFSHAGREQSYAREGMGNFLDTVHPQMRLVTQFNSITYFTNSLAITTVAALAIWLWSISAITVGAIAVSVALALRIQGMAQWIMWEVAMLFENIGVIHDGMAMLNRPVTVADAPDAKPLEITQGRIDFRNVTFHYGKGAGVIENLTLNVAPGEKVGLVGRSGAGKTTIASLLLRFYDVEGGSVLIDGQDVRSVTQESLRANIGVVTQDTSLLHRSIRENVLYGRPDASEADLIEAARRANALEFIESLEDLKGRRGFDAQVGERGVKLSGGQRQRVAIARIFLKNAPILLLDEATSALDSEVEAAIQENLFALMEGKTVIAIAHRLSTIAQLDRLVVLDSGAIIEEGTHEALVARGGLYADLWARQSGGFIGADEGEKQLAQA